MSGSYVYKFIEGANPKHDREMRQQASAAFSSILKWFSANSDNLYKYANQKKSEYPFPFKIPFREIDSTYQDLLLEVDRAQEGEVRTFATFEEIDEVWTFINADCDYSIALLSVNAEYAEHIVKALAAGDASRVGRLVQFSVFSYKSSFVHEFIHYLDRKRQRVDKQLSIPELYTVSNPREFNAWYQHKATVIDALLEKTLSNPGYYRDSFIKRTLLTFDNFWAWVLSVLSEGVSTGIVEHIEDPTSLSIEDLEPKWQRKLKQRFYQYYVDYIKGIASEKAANVERISTFDQLTYASVPKMSGKYIKYREAIYRQASDEDFLYHVTYVNSLPSIAANGLRPGRGESFSKGYSGYSAGKLFLTDSEGMSFWFERLGDMANNRADNPVQDGLIPIAVRVPDRAFEELEDDPVGTKDSRANAYTTTESAAPSIVEVWDGEGWRPVTSINYKDLIEEAYQAAEKDYEDDDELVYLNASQFEPPRA